MKIKKILKIIGIVLLVVLIIVIIHTIRNYIIFKKLDENYSKNSNIQNYYFINKNESLTAVVNYYKKGNKELSIYEKNNNGNFTKMSMYKTGDSINTYIESKEGKFFNNNAGMMVSGPINIVQMDSEFQRIFASIFAFVRNGNYEGKDCYIIDNFVSPYIAFGANCIIEKDTGLLLKGSFNEIVRECKYNSVDDSIFIEPDISQYKIVENKAL